MSAFHFERNIWYRSVLTLQVLLWAIICLDNENPMYKHGKLTVIEMIGYANDCSFRGKNVVLIVFLMW